MLHCHVLVNRFYHSSISLLILLQQQLSLCSTLTDLTSTNKCSYFCLYDIVQTSQAGETFYRWIFGIKTELSASVLLHDWGEWVALTSVRRGLCRGCRAAWRCRSLYCSCCFLTRWWCSRHLSGLRTPAPPCPTGRRRDSSLPADTNRGKTKYTKELLRDGISHSFFLFFIFRLRTVKSSLQILF